MQYLLCDVSLTVFLCFLVSLMPITPQKSPWYGFSSIMQMSLQYALVHVEILRPFLMFQVITEVQKGITVLKRLLTK